MVIAVAAVAVCLGFDVTTLAQINSPASFAKTLERAAFIDFDNAGNKPQKEDRIKVRGGILNLDGAFQSELRANRSAWLEQKARGGEKAEIKFPPSPDIREQFEQSPPDYPAVQDAAPSPDPMTGFQWGEAMKQSMIFLGIQHAFRLATEQGTRADLKGPFFKDYLTALRSLRGWDDADPFIVNYIGHPMMGAVTGFIQIQNDPKGLKEEVSLKKSYWKSRLKAIGWSAAYSTQFELGLISEASIGNIGIRPYGKAKHPMAYVDLVVTPVVGTGWLVGEDALDKYLIRRLENRMPNRTTRALIRSFLNPTRSFANVMRGKLPWYRDNRK